jgi:hypothetical protein
MRAVRVTGREALVEAVLAALSVHDDGNFDADPPEARRTNEDEQRLVRLTPRREIVETLADERSGGQAIEIHARIIAVDWFPLHAGWTIWPLAFRACA